jgi:hypothetical protein
LNNRIMWDLIASIVGAASSRDMAFFKISIKTVLSRQDAAPTAGCRSHNGSNQNDWVTETQHF